MEELEIQGRKYISSKRASELTGYAKDYIGQLARSEKVPASRVGRAWYVEERVILEHAGVTPSSKEGPVKGETNRSRLYSLQELQSMRNQPGQLVTWGEVQYLEDVEPLLPALTARQSMTAHFSGSVDISKKVKKNIGTSARRDSGLSIDGTLRPSSLKNHEAPRLQRPAPSSFPLPFVAIFIASASVFLFVISSVFSSEWSFKAVETLAAGAEAADSLNLIMAFFFSIFDGGVEVIRYFFVTLLESVGDFFAIGLEFILQILNLG